MDYYPNPVQSQNGEPEMFGVSHTLFALIGGLSGMAAILICLLVVISRKPNKQLGQEGYSWLSSLQRIRCPKTTSKIRPSGSFDSDPFYEEVVATNAYMPAQEQVRAGIRHSYAFYSLEELPDIGRQGGQHGPDFDADDGQ